MQPGAARTRNLASPTTASSRLGWRRGLDNQDNMSISPTLALGAIALLGFGGLLVFMVTKRFLWRLFPSQCKECGAIRRHHDFALVPEKAGDSYRVADFDASTLEHEFPW